MNEKPKVGRSYHINSPEEQKELYDDWAASYENDLCGMGYRLPAMAAAVFARFVPLQSGPILDAGCGGGIQSEPLFYVGYGPIIGIDFSQGMLEVAKGKGIYKELRQMALGGSLDFPDETFPVIFSIGTITPKHAPPECFDELIRIAMPGGLFVFSMRNDPDQEPGYPAALEHHTNVGNWRHIFSTDGFQSMPYGQPTITHQVHVYEKL
jgi:SAM-dependent methyltransferase